MVGVIVGVMVGVMVGVTVGITVGVTTGDGLISASTFLTFRKPFSRERS